MREGKERKVGWDRAKGEMGRYREVERKRKEKAKELQGKEAIRKKKKKGKKAEPVHSPFLQLPLSLWSKVEMETSPIAVRRQQLSAKSLSVTWVPI